MAKDVVLRLGVHDASRVEWVTELPLPENGKSEDFELELAAEVPTHIWSEHDHWERLQLLARLASPAEDVVPTEPGQLASIDELRRCTLAAVHRLKASRERLERDVFTAASLFATAVRTSLADDLLDGTRRALAELHRARGALGRSHPSEAPEVTRERSLAEEFLSNHAIEFLSKLQLSVDQQLCGPRSRHRAAYEEMAAGLRPQLARAMADELRWRDERGFLRPEGSDPYELERWVERASILKKHFHEVLFLQLDTERVEQRFRNWFGAIAAMLAALWAFPLGILLTGGAGATGMGLGLSATVALLVISYAVKDRIKEGVRAWLASRVSREWAGRLTTMSTPAKLFSDRFRLMRAREWFFASSERRPDPLNPHLGSTRQVVRLRYVMRGSVSGDPRLSWHGLERAKMVFRYDLSPLFTKLDDPVKQVPVLADDGQAVRFAEAARCYRIHLQLTLRHRGEILEEGGVLVTHKLGLERIERPVAASSDVPPRIDDGGRLASIPWATIRRR